MPPDDYHTPGGGLKLKGSKPSGIKKKKKKPSTTTASPSAAGPANPSSPKSSSKSSPKPPADDDSPIDLHTLSPPPNDGKTPAERAAEEARRKRLGERLLREGAKTHKQRVEELNKYLSNLSEHHDMPKIGPG